MLSYLIVIIISKRLENRWCTEEKTDQHVDKQMDTKTKKNVKKPTLSGVNAAPPATEYLHYPLNVECVTQKSSLLPAHIR